MYSYLCMHMCARLVCLYDKTCRHIHVYRYCCVCMYICMCRDDHRNRNTDR